MPYPRTMLTLGIALLGLSAWWGSNYQQEAEITGAVRPAEPPTPAPLPQPTQKEPKPETTDLHSPPNLQGIPTRDWADALGVARLEPGEHLDEQERALFEQAFNPKEFHDRFHILPYRDPETIACQQEYWQSGEEGTVDPLTTCSEHPGRSRHVYYDYDNETLAVLAAQDAAAAQILGQRLIHIDPDQSWDLHFRAAALSGKPGPLVDLIALRFTSTQANSPEDIYRIHQRILVGRVAERLGYPIDVSSSFVELLRQHVSAKDLDGQIATEVDHLVAGLDAQRRELTGSPLVSQ